MIFLHAGQFFCPQFPHRGKDMIFWMFFVVLFTRFGCDIGQSANIWIWVSSEVTTICLSIRGYAWSVDQLITSLLATPCWRDPTRSKQLPTVAILGFLFGLYHVVFDNTFLAWESTSVKTWGNSLAAGISIGSVAGSYIHKDINSTQNLGPTISF